MLCVTPVGTCYRNTAPKAMAMQNCSWALSHIAITHLRQITSTRTSSTCGIISALFGIAEALRTKTRKSLVITQCSIYFTESPWKDLDFTLQKEFLKMHEKAEKANGNSLQITGSASLKAIGSEGNTERSCLPVLQSHFLSIWL